MNHLKVTTEKTNLKKFIETMKSGDDWWNGRQPRKIGNILERLFGSDAKEEHVCIITRKTWDFSDDPDLHYNYQWHIDTSVEIPPRKLRDFQENGTINDIEGFIFAPRYKIEITKSFTGYIVTLINEYKRTWGSV
jgi:hypothetical protein